MRICELGRQRADREEVGAVDGQAGRRGDVGPPHGLAPSVTFFEVVPQDLALPLTLMIASQGTHVGVSRRPASRASWAASWRSLTWSLVRMLETWLRTVLGLTTSRPAIAVLV